MSLRSHKESGAGRFGTSDYGKSKKAGEELFFDYSKVLEWEVDGSRIQAVHIMLPGYTHNIINLSDTEDLVTVMNCNEVFDPGRPDTFFDPVK